LLVIYKDWDFPGRLIARFPGSSCTLCAILLLCHISSRDRHSSNCTTMIMLYKLKLFPHPVIERTDARTMNPGSARCYLAASNVHRTADLCSLQKKHAVTEGAVQGFESNIVLSHRIFPRTPQKSVFHRIVSSRYGIGP
jgi:hypothetical protein